MNGEATAILIFISSRSLEMCAQVLRVFAKLGVNYELYVSYYWYSIFTLPSVPEYFFIGK